MFNSLVNEALVNALTKQGITTPTKVQQKAIPLILEGKDLIIKSNTGTGKTLTFLLPIFETVDINVKQPQVIIITPTHELAVQVQKEAEKLSKHLNNGIVSALFIGGANIRRQLDILKDKPRIIIGSTGRILELISLKKLKTHYVKTIILDEADRMLDDLNIEGVKAIIKTTLKERQLLFVSATVNEETISRAKQICKEIGIIEVESEKVLPENINHIYFVCERRDKIEIVKKVIAAENVKKALIFLNNQNQLEILVKRLNYHSIKAKGLYGDAFKKDRKQALLNLRDGKITVLVTTDIACRGLDIKGIDYVFNVDIPEKPVFYVHRAGRTGRMGKSGLSVLIATQAEVGYVKKLQSKLNINISAKDIKNGKIINKFVK